jgi:uncharacterized protein (DUF2062 family)
MARLQLVMAILVLSSNVTQAWASFLAQSFTELHLASRNSDVAVSVLVCALVLGLTS